MIATARRLQSTLLVYWVVPDAVYIWTIAPDGAIHDARVDVPLERVTGLVASTRAPASQDAAGGLFALKASSSRRPWRELHELLITPVRAYLPKTADALVTIVPHGPLAQLSFAALQDEQGSYLLERYTLHYTPAVGVLAYTAKRRDERHHREVSASSADVAASTAASPASGNRSGACQRKPKRRPKRGRALDGRARDGCALDGRAFDDRAARRRSRGAAGRRRRRSAAPRVAVGA
jgi:CHAT domain-containing protein